MKASELHVLLTVTAGAVVLDLARRTGAKGLRGRGDHDDSDEPQEREPRLHRRNSTESSTTGDEVDSGRFERSHSMIGGDQTTDGGASISNPTEESPRKRDRRRSDHSGFATAGNML